MLAKAAETDRHNAKAQVNYLFLRIGQSKSLSEMRSLVKEALAIADDLAASVESDANRGVDDDRIPIAGHANTAPTVGSRFYQVVDQGVTLSDCSSKHDLTTVQELADQVRSGITVVRERLANLEASEQREAQADLSWDCSMLSLGTLSVLVALLA